MTSGQDQQRQNSIEQSESAPSPIAGMGTDIDFRHPGPMPTTLLNAIRVAMQSGPRTSYSRASSESAATKMGESEYQDFCNHYSDCDQATLAFAPNHYSTVAF